MLIKKALRLLAGLLVSVAISTSCEVSQPDLLKIIIKDESNGVASLGFFVKIGEWQQEGLTDGTYEIPIGDNWINGAEIPISIVEDLSGGAVGGDLYTGKASDKWTDGVLVIEDGQWDKPLVLNIGDAVAWISPGSWATFNVSPRSGRLEIVESARVAASNIDNRLRSFMSNWERDFAHGFEEVYFCGFYDSWRYAYGSVDANDLELYELDFVKCSYHLETYWTSQVRDLVEYVENSDSYTDEFGRSKLVKSLDLVNDAITNLADTYEREGRYFGTNSDFLKALVYLRKSNTQVEERIASMIEINSKSLQRLTRDSQKLKELWVERCVKVQNRCK